MRAERPLTPDQRTELEGLGVRIRSEIGEIFTAEMPTANLKPLLALDYIRSVEGSRPLYPEQQAAEQ